MIRINGKTLNSSWMVGAKHALYREKGDWYHHLKEFPGALFDKTGYVIFETREKYLTSPFLQHGQDLHVPVGISNMPGYIQVVNGTEEDSCFDLNNEIINLKRSVLVRLRNKTLVHRIKLLYENSCQLCGTKMHIRGNYYYSEVHHIKPLGDPHFGPDALDNMICVCPNHHVLLDLGAITLDNDLILRMARHSVNFEYINYHNYKIANIENR